MAHRKSVILILTLLIFCPKSSWAYENTTTHRAITSEAVKFFNYFYSTDQLTNEERLAVVKGSSDEDMAPRWLNHFYDPISNTGLRGMRSSKVWAQDTEAQAIHRGIWSDFFSSPTDYSWDRAVYDYAWGDKNRGLEALGHTLHLIQDATVPDHTRDDIHVTKKTYEKYADRFTLDNLNIAQKIISAGGQPISNTDLNSAFDQMASYSNGNFFSDDTILAYYDLPKISSEKSEKLSDGKNYKFGYSGDSNIKLSLITEIFDKNSGDIKKSYSLGDRDNLVMNSYWSPLSEKAIEGSAGVMKLFFEAVGQEKIYHKLKDKNKSSVEKFLDNIKEKTGNLLASVNIFATSNSSAISSAPTNLSSASSSLPTDGLAGLVAPEGQIDPTDNPPENSPEPDRSVEDLQKILADLQERLARLKERLGIEDSPSNISNDLHQNLSQARSGASVISSSGGSGSGLASQTVNDLTPTENLPVIYPPIIILPADNSFFATTTVVFSGTASSSLAIFNNYDEEKIATTGSTTSWSLTLNFLEPGTKTVDFWACDGGNCSATTSVSVNIVLPVTIDLASPSCELSPFTPTCLLVPTSTINLSWQPSQTGNYEYEVLKFVENRQTGQFATSSLGITTENNFVVSLADDFSSAYLNEFKFQIVASSTAGEIYSNVLDTFYHQNPLVINEIAWNGTTASSTDNWLELQNYFISPISLDGFYLTDSTDSWRIDLSGIIGASESFYLVERGDDDNATDTPANLVANFGTPTESAFAGGQVGLKLYKDISGVPVLVDQTPVWNMSGQTISTKERKFENSVSSELSSWEDNFSMNNHNLHDRGGNLIIGTPGFKNSASNIFAW